MWIFSLSNTAVMYFVPYKVNGILYKRKCYLNQRVRVCLFVRDVYNYNCPVGIYTVVLQRRKALIKIGYTSQELLFTSQFGLVRGHMCVTHGKCQVI